MSKNESLLSMMPPEAQKQVLLLIKRLGDEKQAKQQSQKQCAQYEAEINELKKELERLKKENVTLKAKWQNSFEKISKVRQNYSGSKKDGEETGKKKLKFNKEQGNWEQESEEEDESTQDQVRMKNVQPQNHFSISSPPGSHLITNIQTNRSSQQAFNLPQNTAKKPPRPNNQSSKQKLNNSLSKQRMNLTNRSNKKLQIQYLRQEIEQLTEEIKEKETNDMTLNEKVKKYEEIKSRYRKGSNNGTDEKMDLSQFQLGSQSTISNSGYYSPRKPVNAYNSQESIIKELSSPYKGASNEQPFFTQTFSSNESHLLKQNIQQQNNGSYGKNIGSKEIMANSNVGRKPGVSSTKQGLQQSFYDEGLLDLIQEMNP